MRYFFFLGRTSDMCFAELKAVLARFDICSIVEQLTPNCALVDSDVINPKTLICVLGGTVKIAEVLQSNVKNQQDQYITMCVKMLQSEFTQEKKNIFSITSNFFQNEIQRSVKQELKNLGIRSRFVGDGNTELSAAQFQTYHPVELQILQYEKTVYIAKTKVMQDIDSWSLRDYGKPYRDPKKGMMPPKLARMMLNIAIGTADPVKTTVYDPFCGTGTMLIEALELGAKPFGSDISREAVYGCGENLSWYVERAGKSQSYSLQVQDATTVSLKDLKTERVDCIVTEPFLGKRSPTQIEIKNIVKGLEKLYIGVLKNIKHIVKPGGKVVIIFPRFQYEKSVKTMQSVIDRLETLGYTREKNLFLYTRPQTTVQREIYVLTVGK